MKIAVTGGSGFIGGRLIKRLQMQGHEIINIDIASIAPIDIEHKEPLIQACAGCDAIIIWRHCIVMIFSPARAIMTLILMVQRMLLKRQKQTVSNALFLQAHLRFMD